MTVLLFDLSVAPAWRRRLKRQPAYRRASVRPRMCIRCERSGRRDAARRFPRNQGGPRATPCIAVRRSTTEWPAHLSAGSLPPASSVWPATAAVCRRAPASLAV